MKNRRTFLKSIAAVSTIAVVPKVFAWQQFNISDIEKLDQRSINYALKFQLLDDDIKHAIEHLTEPHLQDPRRTP